MLTSEFWAEQSGLVKFSVEVEKIPVETKMFLDSFSCPPSVSRALVYKWHKRFSVGSVSTKDNERVGRRSLTDERALTLVRELIDTDRLYCRDV